MELVWHGMSCFRMTERGMATVVTDPYDSSVGLPPLKLKADIVTVSHDAPGHSYLKAVKGKPHAITRPGEYEIGKVFVTGIRMMPKGKKKNANHTNTLYVFDFGGLTVAHLGNLEYVPTQAQIENLGSVNIALVPAAGGGALTAAKAAEVISLIEPSIVVPMQYKTSKEQVGLGGVARFLSEMGVAKSEPLDSLKVTKSSLSEDTQVLVLSPQTNSS
ncbi:MAG: MBL fold metallo-hydrolase [Anaerolineales bacterium]|jgi:L-ascorbate metabolism protein UlaG (beta-lactamase superfamily)